jgi:hypothetical protein
MTQRRKFKESGASFDWAFLFYWMMATTLGWILGGIVFSSLQELSSGLFVAFFQWLVLLGRIDKAWRWLLFSTVGWVIGWIIAFLTVPAGLELVTAMIIGATLGVAQWFILRQVFHWSGWWIAISVVAWSTGMALLPGFLMTGATTGLITGIAMELLLRYGRQPIQNLT